MSEEKKPKVKKPKSKARKITEWVLTGLFLVLFAFVMAGQIDGMVHKGDHDGQQIRFGYGTFMVKTDSMAPKYKINTALITYLEDPETLIKRFNKGDDVDITFVHVKVDSNAYTVPTDPKNAQYTARTNESANKEVDHIPMTHRVFEIHVNDSVKKGNGRYTFLTAGINTKSEWMGWHEGDPELTINQYQAITEKELLGVVRVNSPVLGQVFKFVTSVFGLLILLLIPAFYLVITSVLDIFKAYKDPDEVKEGNKDTTNTGPVTLTEADKKRLKEQLLEEMMSKKKGGDQ